jgi:hypothetical protein
VLSGSTSYEAQACETYRRQGRSWEDDVEMWLCDLDVIIIIIIIIIIIVTIMAQNPQIIKKFNNKIFCRASSVQSIAIYPVCLRSRIMEGEESQKLTDKILLTCTVQKETEM